MDTEETSIYSAVLISCLVISAIIAYFAISIIRQQRKKLELARENILIEISTMEKERSRIANDLHDDLGPILSVIKFQVDNVKVDDQTDQQQLQDASTSIDSLITRMREIANDLMPASLLRKGLFISIGEFIRTVEGTSNIKFNFSNDCRIELPQDVAINVFRIVKEVIHNGVKHSGASEINLKCGEENNILSIYYLDNGVGFNYEKTLASSAGFGLRNFKSRVEIMRGSMTVESKPGKGTAILFKIPTQ